MLAGDRTITTLNLSANNIGDAGALTLAAILKSNTTLEVLDLSSNVIDYDGITAIAEALTDNTSLTSLHIRCFYGMMAANCCDLSAASLLVSGQLLSTAAAAPLWQVVIARSASTARAPATISRIAVTLTVGCHTISALQLRYCDKAFSRP